jgi:hypothetical protein
MAAQWRKRNEHASSPGEDQGPASFLPTSTKVLPIQGGRGEGPPSRLPVFVRFALAVLCLPVTWLWRTVRRQR